MKIGIVGHEAAKFDRDAEYEAKRVIAELLLPDDAILVSGHCHLGGIDIWAEEIAVRLGRKMIIHPPKKLDWSNGYKPRNLLIAKDSDIVHCIVVDKLPESYKGMKFDSCYHCNTKNHVKSGGCWTAKRAKESKWHVVINQSKSKLER